jgi:hypothetical protein
LEMGGAVYGGRQGGGRGGEAAAAGGKAAAAAFKFKVRPTEKVTGGAWGRQGGSGGIQRAMGWRRLG